jgi:hypothetical protein
MKMKKLALFLVLVAFSGSAYAKSDIKIDELTGDTKLACEALLCLKSPNKPKECDPALKKYYSIKAKKSKDTAKKRKNFLKLCPVEN